MKTFDKKFRVGFILFLIGQAFMVISNISIGGEFKALPSWLSLFLFGSIIAYVLFFFALFQLHKYEKGFMYSFITYGILATVMLFKDVTSQSTNDFYIAWSRGLDLTARVLLCIMYVYFFMGIAQYFRETGLINASRRGRVGYITLISMFAVERIFTFIATLKATKLNIVVHSIFKYGAVALLVAIDVFILVTLILVFVYMEKRRKEGLKNEEIPQ